MPSLVRRVYKWVWNWAIARTREKERQKDSFQTICHFCSFELTYRKVLWRRQSTKNLLLSWNDEQSHRSKGWSGWYDIIKIAPERREKKNMVSTSTQRIYIYCTWGTNYKHLFSSAQSLFDLTFGQQYGELSWRNITTTLFASFRFFKWKVRIPDVEFFHPSAWFNLFGSFVLFIRLVCHITIFFIISVTASDEPFECSKTMATASQTRTGHTRAFYFLFKSNLPFITISNVYLLLLCRVNFLCQNCCCCCCCSRCCTTTDVYCVLCSLT